MTNLTGKEPVAVARHQLGTVDFLRSGAYVNLNDLAKPFGKRLDNWMRLKSTKELIEAFEQDPAYGKAKPIYAVKGLADLPSHLRYGLRNAGPEGTSGYGGTLAHPDIGIVFAQWCSPAFALWVSRQIRHLLTYGEVNLHHTEWTGPQRQLGKQCNEEDVKELYSRWRD